MNKISQGDTVTLNSGGPMMTASQVRGEEVEVAWFVEGECFTDTFPEVMLTRWTFAAMPEDA